MKSRTKPYLEQMSKAEKLAPLITARKPDSVWQGLGNRWEEKHTHVNITKHGMVNRDITRHEV